MKVILSAIVTLAATAAFAAPATTTDTHSTTTTAPAASAKTTTTTTKTAKPMSKADAEKTCATATVKKGTPAFDSCVSTHTSNM